MVVIGMYLLEKRHIKYSQIEDEKENLVLQDVSKRTNIKFDDWLSLREYVFCELMKVGMTRDEVKDALSTIGDIRVSGDQIDFANRYLEHYLTPILLKFDGGGQSGHLIGWTASNETNLDAPRAYCETQK
jgi:hypothetical protein